jgi:integrase
MSTPDDLAGRLETFEQRVVGRSISEDTYTEYERWIKRFEQWWDGGEPTIAELEDFDLLLTDASTSLYPWVNNNQKPTPAVYSHSQRIIAISALKLWIRREYGRRIPEQPQDIVVGDPEPFDPTYLPPKEIREAVESASEACGCSGCTAALAVSYDAILRGAELCLLERGDVDLEAGTLSVTAVKGSRDSVLGLNDYTLDLLEDHSQTEDTTERLFTNTYGDPWTRNSWSSHFRTYHHEAGSHAFGRHSPILHMFESGEDFGTVYRRARHVNPPTTARYARLVGADTPDWAAR